MLADLHTRTESELLEMLATAHSTVKEVSRLEQKWIREEVERPTPATERAPINKGVLMARLVNVLDFLFGCHHGHLSRVFTLEGQSYRVCCDCGARYGYSLETMSIKRRLPVLPALTSFRIA